ncbi:hypothetical protein [Tenacibaculum mesophilum]|uniref:Uncharacterized protein n=1 Tax=Tenacibaculum mesophilum TaxID=104268 RepID=A0AAE9SHQ1_9FLAO|nr:hypothetical protein [Tenacibaculum mesophilum]UTD14791.1 hypothetical protein HER15_04520 [Tenacibaculum mesophilum]
MTLEILPDKGFKLNSEFFYWSDERKSVRQKLKTHYKEDDRVIEMSQFFDGDTNHNIDQKRDIYEDTNGMKNYFFLSFDKDNKLCDLEVHWGIKILIDNIEMEFGKDIDIYLNHLKLKGYDFKEIEQGNYLFEKLKITIADSESTGGEGNGLSYFYFGQNIKHLIEY